MQEDVQSQAVDVCFHGVPAPRRCSDQKDVMFQAQKTRQKVRPATSILAPGRRAASVKRLVYSCIFVAAKLIFCSSSPEILHNGSAIVVDHVQRTHSLRESVVAPKSSPAGICLQWLPTLSASPA